MISQNPSPMVEYIRPHERVDSIEVDGVRKILKDVFDRDVILFIPEATSKADSLSVLIHFHGQSSVVEYAVSQKDNWISAVVNLGGGSSSYANPLKSAEVFNVMIESIQNKANKPIDRIFLSGFSAGYGAVRSIIKTPNYNIIDGVILLDGMHAGYIPSRTPLFDGGVIDRKDIEPFIELAKDAMGGEKIFLFTHSSIFPGTYASTTECADNLLNELNLSRMPVLKEGPVGMQMLSATKNGKLSIYAFAGNTAPDHIDHFHGLYEFLNYIDNN